MIRIGSTNIFNDRKEKGWSKFFTDTRGKLVPKIFRLPQAGLDTVFRKEHPSCTLSYAHAFITHCYVRYCNIYIIKYNMYSGRY